MTDIYDLIVVGHGAAGLAAAVTYAQATAADPGRRIAVLERSTAEERGGATQWTGAFLRITEDLQLDTDWTDRVDRAAGGLADLDYCRAVETDTPDAIRFLQQSGVDINFAPFPFPHTFNGGVPSMRPPASPAGGGASIVSSLSAILESDPRVDLRYETEAVTLTRSPDGAISGIIVREVDGATSTLTAPAVILACGGFEGNYDLLAEHVGSKSSDLLPIAPGISNNRGDALRMVLEVGGDTAGQFDGIHAEPVDRRSSGADAVLYGYQAGILVNGSVERFFDEGRDTWDNTFEHVGSEIWKNQNQEAYWIGDARSLQIGFLDAFLSEVPPEQADTLAELADKLGIDPDALSRTVDEFNTATGPEPFDHTRMDGKATHGLTPPKSNWASPLEVAPFVGIPLTAAICFTFGGVRTDLSARVVTASNQPIAGLYAAGETTGLFHNEYPPATSVLRSLIFGRRAGAHIAAGG